MRIFERFRKGLVRSAVHLFVWLGFAILYYFIFSLFFDTPIEREMRKANDSLESEYESLKSQYDSLEVVLTNVKERDQGVYRTLFGSNPNYNDKESHLTIDSLSVMTNKQLASQFHARLNRIDYSLGEITNNFAALQEKMIEKGSGVGNIPSIQPISNNELTRLAASYGMRIHPFYRTLVAHQGVDYAVSLDSRVYATADGKVKFVKQVHQTNGLSVIIDHGNGYETVYSHLDKALVRRGQKVKRGDIIARSGNSGLSFMPHLHYEVVYKGMRQDPINYFFQELDPQGYARIIDISHIGMQSLD